MSRSDPAFNLRIPSDLKEKIAALAKMNKRSINAEIVAAVELSCQKAFGGLVEHEDGTEIILDEKDSLILESHIKTLKKIEDTEKKVDALLVELQKINKRNPRKV
ncbi:Arc family DNA-binding protein [Salmonella enterica]|nr:Arc family DNA-binding protein [Salmonella enterica]EFT9362499.1 Arc family DNA-binding protein [Salmonella enterica]EIM8804826.1 Arc family DNA-binding protein [Salmonella enterica]